VSNKSNILKQYGQSSVALAQRLKEGAPLNTDKHMFVENDLLIVQLALAMSTHVHTKRPVPVRGE